MLAEPGLQEPVYQGLSDQSFFVCARLMTAIVLVEVQCPPAAIGGVYTVLNKRRAQIISEDQRAETQMFTVKAYMPVAESFGFNNELRAATSGRAFPQCVFDHWETMDSSKLDDPSRARYLDRHSLRSIPGG